MRVLVAGASGAVGRGVVAELRRAGHEVRGDTGEQIVRGLGVQPVVADVLDRDRLLRALDGMAADAVVYGPGSASERIVKMLRQRTFPMPTRGGGTFGWTFSDDAATVAALERGRTGQAHNIVDDQPATWAEMLDAMAHGLGARRPLRVPGPLIRLVAPFFADQVINTSMRVSNAKAKTELGWQPSMPTYQHA